MHGTLTTPTYADIDWSAEIEDSLFPVGGCVHGACAKAGRTGCSSEAYIKIPHKSLRKRREGAQNITSIQVGSHT